MSRNKTLINKVHVHVHVFLKILSKGSGSSCYDINQYCYFSSRKQGYCGWSGLEWFTNDCPTLCSQC